MNIDRDMNAEAFESPGERLNHILDYIGFKQGRGRVAEFQNFLINTSPKTFEDLKYTTVRSWFQENAPPMRKIDAIMEALQKEYEFRHNISQIKTWWKLGGYYPFPSSFSGSAPTIDDLKEELDENDQKLQFQIMSLVTEETGENFANLSSHELYRIKEKAVTFATDYADPFKIVCPNEYIRLIIQHELNEILLSKQD